MTEIVLVRHAHAEWFPDEDRPLSETGWRDAERLVPILDATAPERLYSSPYPRAVQTIEPLAAHLGLPIEPIDGFRERTLAEGAVSDFEAAMRASWDDFSLTFPGGESSSFAQERIHAAFCELAERHRGGRALVATHGNVLALLFHRFDAANHYAFWQSITWPDVFRVSLTDGRVIATERLWS